jgi:predicted nucleic acid-binding protein
MLAVSNTSPIFNLACIGRLHLLQAQFGEIWIPSAVETELADVPDEAVRTTIDQTRKAGWLRVQAASDTNLVSLLTVELHRGEVEAIALAVEMKARWLLMDEREGRGMARRLGLHVTGVLGVLLRGKKLGHLEAIKPEIDALRAKAHFFIGPDLERAVLSQAAEG